MYVCVLAISLSTEWLFDALGNTNTFLLFCILNLIGGLFILIYVKEITGLSKKQLE